jgi:malonyl-CoA decarboxylase
MNNAFFADLLTSISERGRTLLRRVGSSDDPPDAAGA